MLKKERKKKYRQILLSPRTSFCFFTVDPSEAEKTKNEDASKKKTEKKMMLRLIAVNGQKNFHIFVE